MAKLQSFKRLIIEDFSEKDRPLVSKIAYAVNIAFEDILNALNKNLSITDNLSINQKTLSVTVDGTGAPKSTTTLSSGLGSTCTGISVISARNLTNASSSPTTTPFITFVDNSGSISIQKITGLQENNSYQLQLILWTQ